MKEQFIPFGFNVVDTNPAPKVVIRNGNVYLTEEDGSLYYCGRHVEETSGHEFVSNRTIKADGTERVEYYEWSSSLADRMVEAEQFGLSSHLEDDRYMRVGRHEDLCSRCFMVKPEDVACAFCE